MKFQILSDIHDEFYDEFNSYIKTQLKYFKVDALILAGDIVTPQTMHRLKCLEVPVYFVLGNHEYYNGHWDNSLNDYQEYFKDSNIHVLENETVIVTPLKYSEKHNQIRIIGASLWTDFIAPSIVGKQHHGAGCVRGMSDFTLIREITIQKWEERHKKSLKFIMDALSIPHSGPTIVITHHAPSFQSSHPMYVNSPISGGFCSELSNEIMELQHLQPKYWIHGHCHESFRYNLADTEVICNPRGYPHELNPNFNKNLLIEL
jgi:predicted phosphodiesterase